MSVPSIDSYQPTLLNRQRIRRVPPLKVYATKAQRMVDENNPAQPMENRNIMGQLYWKCETGPCLLTVFGSPTGKSFQVLRDSKKGRDSYGLGEELIKDMEKDGYAVTRRGDLDLSVPYIIRLRGKNVELETDHETKWPEMMYDFTNEAMRCLFLPDLKNLPSCKMQISTVRANDGINHPAAKNAKWENQDGKLFKRNMSDVKTLLKEHAKAEKEKARQLAKARKLKAADDKVALKK